MNKRILLKEDARLAIQKGVNVAADTVSVTLGYNGKNVMISQNYVSDYGFQSNPLICSQDGANVISHIQLIDPIENMGVLLVRQASQKTADVAGDGSTTTALLTQAIVNEGIKMIQEGVNAVQLKKGMDKAVQDVVAELKKMAIPVENDIEKIRNVATVSANNDSFIGDLIAEAYSKIGNNGIITWEDSQSVETSVRVTDGFQFDKGFISLHFLLDKGKDKIEFDDPYILLYDRTIRDWKDIEPLLVTVGDRPLLIICADAEGEALAGLLINNSHRRFSACVVKAPLFGDLQKEMLEDISVCVGGEYISDLKGMKLENTTLKMLGEAKRVTITKDSTTIVGGVKNKEAQEELLNDLKMNLTQVKNDAEKTRIQKRIARLTGGVAVLSIGAYTEVELKERKDRCEDAVLATRSTIEEGYLPGAGTAFLRMPYIDGSDLSDFDKGRSLISRILYKPLEQICINSGVDSHKIMNEVKVAGGNMGYNAKTDKVEDLIEAGILDPAKVLRCSIENAASAAGMLLTSDALICDVFN